MPKAIIEVYFELLVTNFYNQISCSCHSKFVKIIAILMHRIAINVFVYISFSPSTKMFWLVTCPTNLGQKQWPSSILYNDCKQQIKQVILISTPALVMIFIKTISDVFAHASYKCPVNSQPCPQSSFKKIALAPHDYEGNFYLI